MYTDTPHNTLHKDTYGRSSTSIPEHNKLNANFVEYMNTAILLPNLFEYKTGEVVYRKIDTVS